MDSTHPMPRSEPDDGGDARPAVLERGGGIPHALHAAANFSIDPLLEVVDSLGRDLGIGMSSAPFDHVLQCLHGQAGAPPETARELLLLLSLEDWCRREELGDHAACEAARAVGATTRFLPNGQQIMELHEYETDYLYGEIFDRADYLPSAIKLPPAAAVIDVGANIGMFSLFVLSHSPDARVIAIEPSPVTAKICAANLSGRGRATVLQLGVGEQAGLQRFTHYEGATVFSGFHADVARDRKALEAAIENEMRAHGGETAATLAAEFVGDRLNAVAADVRITSISDLIDEYRLDFVDLLKIDAEHSEAAILRGIRAEHWPKIRQIVVETHDDDGDESGWIRRHLAANGFELSSAVDPHLENSGLSLLYAVRPGASEGRTRLGPHPAMLGLRERVDSFGAALRAFRTRSSLPVHLIVGPYGGGGAVSDHVGTQLDRALQTLRAVCDNVPGVYLSDWETMSAVYPVPVPAADEAAREVAIPYSPEWFAAAGAWALRRYAARHRLPHKLVAVDADNTLWQGACAELGIEGVVLSPASLALQGRLKRLKEAGYLLALISKNVPEDVWEVFEKRHDMLLRRDDFAAVEINWKAKSANLAAVLEKLGLNADSLIFIDDNEIECAEVQAALPAALTIRFPGDEDEALALLDQHWALDCVPVATIDRTASARQEVTRAGVRESSTSFRAFVEALGLEVRCETAGLADVERLAELTRRTNQFNLHSRIQPEAVLRTRMENGSDRIWKVSARDKFGDYGIVGLIAASTVGSYCVDQFLLSCRALGRGVEQQMLLHVVRDAQALGHGEIELYCRRTSRNEPAMAFVAAIGRIDERRALATIAADEAVQARLQDLDEWFESKPSAGPVAAARDTTLLDDRYRDGDWLLQRLQAARSAKAIAELVWPEYRGPRALVEGSEAEREVARAWENALGRSVASIDVDFFSIGGTSLRLVQVIGELRRRGYRQLSIKEAYRATTIRAMAAALGDRAAGATDRSLMPASVSEGDRDLSAPEQALWFEHQRNARSSLYVTVVPLLLDPAPDPEVIRAAWTAVCTEHALLRTTYRLDGRRSVATPWPESISAWRFLDGAIWDVPDAFDYVRRRSKDPIDLGRSPVGIDVLTLPDERCLVVLRIHHIVADFQSLSLVLGAFGEKLADAGADAPAPHASAYAAFAAAAPSSSGGLGRRPASGGGGDRNPPWWAKASRGSATKPVAEPNPIVIVGRLSRRAEGGVAAAAALHRVSPLSVLIAGFASFVHRESGQAELRVGTPVSLRDPVTYRDTVGNFAVLANLRIGDLRLPFDPLVQVVHRTIGDALADVHAGASGEIAGDDVDATFAYHEHLDSDPILSLLPDGETSAPFALGPSRARLLGITPQVGLAPLGIDAFEDREGLVVVLKCRAGTLGRPEAEALMDRLVRHLGQALSPGRDCTADTVRDLVSEDLDLKAPSCT